MGARTKKVRITINHMNIPNMVGQITTILANEGINISDMINKSKDKYAYTMLDIDDVVSDDAVANLRSINGVLKLRVLM